jgi:signal transduction histidine kinase
LALLLASRYSYLLFHSLVELFSVIIACGIFIISWNSRRIMNNSYFLFIGIASLFVGAVDLLHTLAYKGMGVFPGYGPNLATQLWIVARYLQGFSLLLAPLFLGHNLRERFTLTAFSIVTLLLLAAVFSGNFPVCFVDGTGLTTFKKGSEYLVALMLVGSLLYVRQKRMTFDRSVMRIISGAIILFIASELSFTLYTDVYGISNLVGHFLKFAGFYLMYKALIESALVSPYGMLFRELKASEESYRRLSEERKEAAAQIEILNTELSAHSRELEEANCELESALDGLEVANRELEIANQELEAFNYTVSHDLRSPLTGIIGMSELLTVPHHNLSQEDTRHYLQMVNHSARRMDQLISTLLNFSRLGRGELSLGTVDLSRLAHEIALQLRISDPARHVSFAIAEGLTATGDARLLKVVMENLMGNAWKYTARREDTLIEVGSVQQNGKSEFFVRDNGVGFDMAQAGRLFAPFQRLHDREDFDGNGIGLATVRRVIDRHGGQVRAEGEPGHGATFFFLLPSEPDHDRGPHEIATREFESGEK